MESSEHDGNPAAISLPFLLERWMVFPDRLELICGTKRVRIEPLTMRLLCLLASNADRTTSRRQIVEVIWAGRIVTDDAYARQIKKLRDALGDCPKNPRILETIPKVGVRLLVVPRPIGSEAERGSRGAVRSLLEAVRRISARTFQIFAGVSRDRAGRGG